MDRKEIAEVHAKMLNETVLVTLAPSKIHGIGVFAIQPIKTGQLLQPFAAIRTFGVEVLSLLKPEVRFIVEQRNSCRTTFEHPNVDATMQAWMNHSDTPNSTGRVALRDIQSGEEITENYRDIGAWASIKW